jgi:hypothetical protein
LKERYAFLTHATIFAKSPASLSLNSVMLGKDVLEISEDMSEKKPLFVFIS